VTSMKVISRSTSGLLVCSALSIATAAEWFLGSGRLGTLFGARTASTVIIVIALVKVRLVGLHFMELNSAPVPLRAAFELYVTLGCGLLLGFYVFSS